jgi:hypothetical protein
MFWLMWLHSLLLFVLVLPSHNVCLGLGGRKVLFLPTPSKSVCELGPGHSTRAQGYLSNTEFRSSGLFVVVMGLKPRTSHNLGNLSTSEPPLKVNK